MATKDDRPNLLSKVAMFVRNPTKDWSELDRPEPDQEAGYDKQALKAMIERKRQNDFVRKREFDQLRKMRSRDAAALGAMARPSLFQSSLATDPDGRAVTLKKIDEIEAQMSKQWWKNKQEAGANPARSGTAAARLATQAPAAEGLDAPTMAPETGFEPTATVDLHSAQRHPGSDGFEATQVGAGLTPEVQQPKPMPSFAGAASVGVGAGKARAEQPAAQPGFSTSELFAIEVDELNTDPELEEAAIRFANGDDEGAESALVQAMRGQGAAPEIAQSWLLALLDLHRATAKQDRFDAAVLEFGHLLGGATPRWYALSGVADSGAPGARAAAPTAAAARTGGAIWTSPVKLGAAAMESLRDAMSSQPPPWHIDWSALVQIDADAMPLLDGLFASLCAEEVSLRFSGSDQLVQALRALMPSGDRSVGLQWWAVRLNALRSMRLQDEFELAALDYCVTFEVAPPAWEDPRCTFEDVAPSDPAAASPDAGWPATVPPLTDGVATMELKGEVLGDATQAFAALNGHDGASKNVIVACAGLIRVDFSAAGSILNWVATRQSEGCTVQLRDVHRLVAAFFNVIGINEHAKVIPRSM